MHVQGCALHAHVVHVCSKEEAPRTWNVTDEGTTSAMLRRCFGQLSQPMQCVATLGPAQSLQFPRCCPLYSRIPQRRTSNRTICAHPCKIPVPSLHFSAEKTQQESPKAVILKMRECHNDPQLDGEWSLNRLKRRNHGSHNPTVRAAETTVWPAQKATATVLHPCLRSALPVDKQSDNPQGA